MGYWDAVNGFVQREAGGHYGGNVTVDGVDLSPIEATYFKQEGESYLWLRRKPIMEYDFETQSYKTRKREPSWECYLKKMKDGSAVAYRGEFSFLRFRYAIYGIWDNVLGNDKALLNLYVERLPMNQQTILNGVNERKRRNG